MTGRLTLRIFTPDAFREETAEAVWLPGAYAPMELLPSHAQLTAALTAGEIRWKAGEGEERFSIRSGVFTIAQDIVTICVEKA